MAGDASALPAASNARTARTWLPSARPAKLAGVEQDANAAPSSEHSKVTGDSSAEKANEALELALAAGGPLTMLVSGARVSTVQAHCAGVGSTLPAASTALTVNVR